MLLDHAESDEPRMQDNSLVYKKCKFYTYRECSTCNIQRLPKANHCSVCNNCVKGFDHHCTLLNNCVGKRTLRTFMILLFCSTLFYFLSGVIGTVAMLWTPFHDPDESEGKKLSYDSIVSIIIVAIQLIKFIFNCCCTQCITFGTQIIWIIAELLIALALGISQLSIRASLATPLVSLGFSVMLLTWPLFRKHLDFIMHHLTEKEFHARLETSKKHKILDYYIGTITGKQKCRNIYKFLCCRKIPKSEIL